jgi:hypothetical protein
MPVTASRILRVEAKKGIEDPEKIYYCKFAIDSRRGIFYSFKWERHRSDALGKSTPSLRLVQVPRKVILSGVKAVIGTSKRKRKSFPRGRVRNLGDVSESRLPR